MRNSVIRLTKGNVTGILGSLFEIPLLWERCKYHAIWRRVGRIVWRGIMKEILEMQRLMKEAYDHYFQYGDGHCKSAEGQILLIYPTYHVGFSDTPCEVHVYSYVLGPHRTHSFNSLDEALETVREWHKQEMENDYKDNL